MRKNNKAIKQDNEILKEEVNNKMDDLEADH